MGCPLSVARVPFIKVVQSIKSKDGPKKKINFFRKILFIKFFGPPVLAIFAICDDNYFIFFYYTMATYYALRLTPYPNTDAKTLFCRQRIASFIEAIGGENYLFGQEFEKNFHFHIVFSHPESFTISSGQKITEIKKLLYEVFEVPKKKQGNPTYSMEVVRNLEHALSYAVKDGCYEASSEWIQIAVDAYENSFEKKYSMKRSLGDLTEQYNNGVINDKQLWIGLGQSRADLLLPLSLKWVDEMLLSIQCKKDPKLLDTLWEKRQIKS